jgi:hypothetical protein
VGELRLRSTATHQFSLRLTQLIVDPAQHVPRGKILIVLAKAQVQARRREFALLPGLEEMAARISKHTRTNQHDIGDGQWLEFHQACPRRISSR